MANVLVNETHLTNIANAIRSQNGTTDTYKPGEMADAIRAISTSENLDAEIIDQNSLLLGQDYWIDEINSALDEKISGSEGGNSAEEQLANFIQNSNIGVFRNNYLTTTHSYSIANKSTLTTLILPALVTLSNYGISSCTALTRIDFTAITSIGTGSFNGCTALDTLILRGTTVCTLGNVNSLARSKIESGTGYIYVPDNLVDTYKTATNWSTYAAQIKGLSELEG